MQDHCNVGENSSVGGSRTTKVAISVAVGKYDGVNRMTLQLKILIRNVYMFAEERNVIVKIKFIDFKINNELQFC